MSDVIQTELEIFVHAYSAGFGLPQTIKGRAPFAHDTLIELKFSRSDNYFSETIENFIRTSNLKIGDKIKIILQKEETNDSQ